MTNKKMIQRVLLMMVSIGLLGGCIKQPSKGTPELLVAIGSESGSLDPSGAIATTYLTYAATALDELLTFDEQGQIEYRAAEAYEVNADNTEFTLHLRREAKWSDGSPVTAVDFINTMQRALKPESQSGYVNYLFPIKNAEAIYHQEADPDSLGVTAPDPYTLVFTLETPCVYFLELLRLPVYMPSCSKYADNEKGDWAKNPKYSVANGPFYLAEYEAEQYFVLKKNPYYWNAKAISLEQITYRFFDHQQSMVAAYETGEVDLATGLHATVMEKYQGMADLVVTDLVSTRYLYPNLATEPLDDVRVRKALALAIDREELCLMTGLDTEPTVNFVAKYLPDRSTGDYFINGSEAPFEEDLKQARQLLAEAGYPEGQGFPTLTYSYPSLEMDADVAQILKEQWRKNLNIEVELNAQELQVNYAERRQGNFELCRMNWMADFSDPYTYLSMLLSNSPYNCSNVADPEYDRLLAASDRTADPTKRAQLLHQAEQWAVGEQYYVIPLFSVKNCSLIRPSITGIGKIAASGNLEYRYAKMAE